MRENGNVEVNPTSNSSENVEEEISEIHTMTQEAFNEQIEKFIALLTCQIEELTRLVQGIVATPHVNHYPRTNRSTISGTAAYQPDNH